MIDSIIIHSVWKKKKEKILVYEVRSSLKFSFLKCNKDGHEYISVKASIQASLIYHLLGLSKLIIFISASYNLLYILDYMCDIS